MQKERNEMVPKTLQSRERATKHSRSTGNSGCPISTLTSLLLALLTVLTLLALLTVLTLLALLAVLTLLRLLAVLTLLRLLAVLTLLLLRLAVLSLLRLLTVLRRLLAVRLLLLALGRSTVGWSSTGTGTWGTTGGLGSGELEGGRAKKGGTGVGSPRESGKSKREQKKNCVREKTK